MADQHGFGDNRTQSTRLCQSGHGNDQMNEQDQQVTHPGNRINTSKAATCRLIWQFAMDRRGNHRVVSTRWNILTLRPPSGLSSRFASRYPAFGSSTPFLSFPFLSFRG